jgi:hypothetical protein
MFSGFTRKVISELDDFGEVPCAFRVLSAFAMGAKREDRIFARAIGLT